MKSFVERSHLVVGAIGLAAVVAVTLAGLNYQKLPLLNQRKDYSAYFADAGGLSTNAIVEVSGYPVGKVASIELERSGVLVTFKVNNDIHLGEASAAAIKTRGLLGNKILDVTPRGAGTLTGAIPMDRTISPYQLPDALGDLATTISGVNTNQLSDSLATLAQTFADTPRDLRNAVQGLARFGQILNARDAELRSLLDNAAKATGVLAKRTDQVVSLVHDTNALLAQLRTQSIALEQISTNISAVSLQLKGFIADNRSQLRPALDKLNGVLAIVDKNKERLQRSLPLLNRYVMQMSEVVSAGPFFKVYVNNLLPGQFIQPFVDAAFSDLGVDPATLLPSQLTDPQTGQQATPPLPVPYPRTGQGGEPSLSLPEAITGKVGDPRYPYREPLPASVPGSAPPGPPANLAPAPVPAPIYSDDPIAVAPTKPGGQP